MHDITQKLYRKIRARLYLNAVLPAFEDLLAHSEDARTIIGNRKFTLTFQTSSGLKSSLSFKNQQCEFVRVNGIKSQIILHFITEEQLNKEFENEGFRVPIPIKGASRVGDLKAFKALSKLLESYLRPSKSMLEDPQVHSQHVGLQLGIALRATIELTKYEQLSGMIMQDTPDGIAYFSVGSDGYGAWLNWQEGTLTSGKGPPATEAHAHVEFANAETALKAVGNQIDVMAAVGNGEIKVTGLIPLADALGYIFERIPLYITP
tara:strand:- start:6264 stop:7052 length:789 start_codon:yes stop_codon:yes gene_type:complete